MDLSGIGMWLYSKLQSGIWLYRRRMKGESELSGVVGGSGAFTGCGCDVRSELILLFVLVVGPREKLSNESQIKMFEIANGICSFLQFSYLKQEPSLSHHILTNQSTT